jgi:endonuclease/exonuclease/phosphatase family metal-dependent hydrolase
MPARLVIVFVVALLAASAHAQHTVRVKLAAHNFENMFDIFDDPYTPDEKARIKSNKSIEALGRVHQKLDADFLGVEEVESEGVLAYFRQKFLADRGYDYLWLNYIRGGRGINCGFMSKVPVGPITIHKFQPLKIPGDGRVWTFSRDLAGVELRPAEDVRIQCWVVHFKSKLDAEGDKQGVGHRTAEMLQLRRIASELLKADPKAYYAAMGDFNETPEGAPLARLLEGGVFIDPHAANPPEGRISYLKEPYRSNIDYVLLSPALARCVVPGTAVLAEADDEGSDHAPVTVTVDLPTRQPDARAGWRSPLPVKGADLFFKPDASRGGDKKK